VFRLPGVYEPIIENINNKSNQNKISLAHTDIYVVQKILGRRKFYVASVKMSPGCTCKYVCLDFLDITMGRRSAMYGINDMQL
jgi:hypothetical protein